MGTGEREVMLHTFLQELAPSEGESLAYARWWWWKRRNGEGEIYRYLEVRDWTLLVSELKTNIFHVIAKPGPTLIYMDPGEFEGYEWVRAWIWEYKGADQWKLIASVERDGYGGYKKVYRSIKYGR